MDSLKKYILMCSKSDEIQKLKPDKSDSSGQIFICEICGNTYIEDDGINWCQNHIDESKNPIWLPDQGQLQDMLLKDKTPDSLDKLLYEFYEESWGYRTTGEWQWNSKELSYEQLWLSFVMKKKYSKQWDNNKEEWIEIK